MGVYSLEAGPKTVEGEGLEPEAEKIHEGDPGGTKQDATGEEAVSTEVFKHIEKLAELKERGFITQEEFETKKKELLE